MNDQVEAAKKSNTAQAHAYATQYAADATNAYYAVVQHLQSEIYSILAAPSSVETIALRGIRLEQAYTQLVSANVEVRAQNHVASSEANKARNVAKKTDRFALKAADNAEIDRKRSQGYANSSGQILNMVKSKLGK